MTCANISHFSGWISSEMAGIQVVIKRRGRVSFFRRLARLERRLKAEQSCMVYESEALDFYGHDSTQISEHNFLSLGNGFDFGEPSIANPKHAQLIFAIRTRKRAHLVRSPPALVFKHSIHPSLSLNKLRLLMNCQPCLTSQSFSKYFL